jgi:hypothetical protein
MGHERSHSLRDAASRAGTGSNDRLKQLSPQKSTAIGKPLVRRQTGD